MPFNNISYHFAHYISHVALQPRPQGSLLSCAGDIGTPGQANDIPVLNGCVNTIDWDQNQSDLSDLTLSMLRVTGSLWIADFRSWTWQEVAIPVANQTDRGLWERDWLHSYRRYLCACAKLNYTGIVGMLDWILHTFKWKLIQQTLYPSLTISMQLWVEILFWHYLSDLLDRVCRLSLWSAGSSHSVDPVADLCLTNQICTE